VRLRRLCRKYRATIIKLRKICGKLLAERRAVRR
jgi:hypothetical protein